MNIDDWLRQSQRQLTVAGIETARLDCLVLLEDYLNKNRTQLLAHPELEITVEQQKYLWKCVERRTKHEPLAYIRGKVEFYGREFIVDKHVLVPRPESEAIIELLKAKAADLPDHPRIADVGTGSGVLGITAKLELPNAQVDLFEVDQAALDVAQKNINKFSMFLDCFLGDLLATANTLYDVVITNLPYVPNGFSINRAAQVEPRLAIFGGADGLDLYRRLFAQLQTLSQKPSVVLTESLPQQHADLAEIARNVGFKLAKTEDFIQQFVA